MPKRDESGREELPSELGVLSWKRENCTDGYIKFEFTSVRGTEMVTVREISATERVGRKMIGAPVGKNLEHCLYLGLKYEPNFAERVDAFYVDSRSDPLLEQLRRIQPGSVRIELYGAK